ncbi:MAG: PCMD domain-containing protein [Muribaculaceae bacterium]|nr:PCMD domain-containing protein [Muribaculaceae bacterium]
MSAPATYKYGRLSLAALFIALVMAGCIKNDIPYPRIQANFLTFSVEGESQAAVIDSATRVVNLTLGEEVDIYSVNVADYTVTPGAEVEPGVLDKPLNLSRPVAVMLKIYQEHWWVIKATQNIERYFNVSGQIGTSVIDVPAHRVIVTMPDGADLANLRVTSMKLGAVGSTVSPDINGSTINLKSPLEVTVTTHGREEIWTIYAEVTSSTVTTVRADAWTNVAWIYGQAQEGKDNGFEYRRGDSDDWQRVPADWITHDGGDFTARLVHLDPETEYAARAYSDTEYAAEVVFTTGSVVQVPNRDFEYWWLNGKVWNPWAEGGESYWDTGNKGATTLGPSNTQPTNDTPTGTGRAAMLETRFVGVGTLGKLAAGNIFTGVYVRTDGTNGVLSFGRPFTQRPTRMRGYLKYNSVAISHTSAGFEDLKGRPDTCVVWAALIDSPEPFEIRTNPKNRQLFDPAGPEVVAYANIQYGESVNNYVQFDIEFDYRSTQRVPNYLIIVGSASKYGDYFTGGNGSVLYLDDFELMYDY